MLRAVVGQTLAHRVATLDRERFSGRGAELALLEGLLRDDAAGQVALVHGPGGIGKSALLRELARRAERVGFVPRVLDGREVLPVPGEIERALEGIERDERPLVVFDSYERMAGADGWLRQTLLPSLPERAVVVLAGRGAPADGWFRDGWEHVVVDVELAPLGPADARALLAAYGVADDDEAGELVRWAKGWPLALSLATTGLAREEALVADDLDRRPDLLRTAVARVARAELDDGGFDAVAVAAIARACDAPMLRAVPSRAGFGPRRSTAAR